MRTGDGGEIYCIENQIEKIASTREEANTVRIAFICVENSCRSQIAEALAKKLCDKPNIEFISMGTHPANEVDPKALKVLQEEGIRWQGKPKIISNKEKIDIMVTMGCDVACPIIPGAKIIAWDIPDPKGKDIQDYRRTLGIIKEKIIELIEEEVR